MQRFHAALLWIVLATVCAVFAPAAVAQEQRYPPDAYGSGPGAVPNAPNVSAPGIHSPVPAAPVQPVQVTRPGSWPGAAPPAAPSAIPPAAESATVSRYDTTVYPVQRPQPSRVANLPKVDRSVGQPQDGAADCKTLESAQVVARVGPEAILVSDLFSTLDMFLDRSRDKIPAEQFEAQRKSLFKEILTAIEEAPANGGPRGQLEPEKESRRNLLQRLLKEQAEMRLMYYDAKLKIPADKFPDVEKQLTKHFEQTEAKRLLKQNKVQSWRELDQALRAHGTSFERERQAFIVQNLAHQWARQQMKVDERITFDDMLSYYREHAADFDRPARVRWQELMVPFSKFPLKAEAFAAIAALGNQLLQGADFETVAEAGGSDTDGALRDWTEKSQALSATLEEAIRGLPAGQLSPILEDVRGYHIVRVAERKVAYHEPFETSQLEIREKIQQQRMQTEMQTYLKRLREQIPVWTVLDEKDETPEVSFKPRYRTRLK